MELIWIETRRKRNWSRNWICEMPHFLHFYLSHKLPHGRIIFHKYSCRFKINLHNCSFERIKTKTKHEKKEATSNNCQAENSTFPCNEYNVCNLWNCENILNIEEIYRRRLWQNMKEKKKNATYKINGLCVSSK